MYELLRAALPEFLGSLGAAFALVAGAWTARRLRGRRHAAPLLHPGPGRDSTDGAVVPPPVSPQE
ncbi:hypothetical protein ABZV67_38805 [Streptomyces sp. NPDC005065]|uniref:hypothetical protein n=1 Tax=Streptomyces sp. NPDC005065 TaxID=3154461 RepID=UPI0033B54813